MKTSQFLVLKLCLALLALAPSLGHADLCRGLFDKSPLVDTDRTQWKHIQKTFRASLDEESFQDLTWFSAKNNRPLARELNQKLLDKKLGSMSSRQLLVSQTLTSLLSFNPVLLTPGSLLFVTADTFQVEGDFFTFKKGQRFLSQQFLFTHLNPQSAWHDKAQHTTAPVYFIIETEGVVPAIPSLDATMAGFILGQDVEFEVIEKSHNPIGPMPFHLGLPTLYVHLRARQAH